MTETITWRVYCGHKTSEKLGHFATDFYAIGKQRLCRFLLTSLCLLLRKTLNANIANLQTGATHTSFWQILYNLAFKLILWFYQTLNKQEKICFMGRNDVQWGCSDGPAYAVRMWSQLPLLSKHHEVTMKNSSWALIKSDVALSCNMKTFIANNIDLIKGTC